MEDNIRQSVTNSIKAGLTEQMTQASRIKTDWQSISPTASFPVLCLFCTMTTLNRNQSLQLDGIETELKCCHTSVPYGLSM